MKRTSKIYPDGVKYVGEWKNQKRHGEGGEYINGVENKSGFWLRGKYAGKEKPEKLK